MASPVLKTAASSRLRRETEKPDRYVPDAEKPRSVTKRRAVVTGSARKSSETRTSKKKVAAKVSKTRSSKKRAAPKKTGAVASGGKKGKAKKTPAPASSGSSGAKSTKRKDRAGDIEAPRKRTRVGEPQDDAQDDAMFEAGAPEVEDETATAETGAAAGTPAEAELDQETEVEDGHTDEPGSEVASVDDETATAQSSGQEIAPDADESVTNERQVEATASQTAPQPEAAEYHEAGTETQRGDTPAAPPLDVEDPAASASGKMSEQQVAQEQVTASNDTNPRNETREALGSEGQEEDLLDGLDSFISNPAHDTIREQSVPPTLAAATQSQNDEDGDSEDQAELEEFVRKLNDYHQPFDSAKIRRRMLFYEQYRIDILKLLKNVKQAGDFDAFTDLSTWWHIAEASGLKIEGNESAYGIGGEIMEFYMHLIDPVFPVPKKEAFLQQIRAVYGDLYWTSERYAKTLIIPSKYGLKDLQVCPCHLAERIAQNGGYAAVQAIDAWQSIAMEVGRKAEDTEKLAVKLRSIGRELLDPLAKDPNASAERAEEIAAQYKKLMLGLKCYHRKKTVKDLQELAKVHGANIDLFQLKAVMSEKDDNFNHTVDIGTWERIADQLEVPKWPERGTLLKRVWRRVLDAHLKREEEIELMTGDRQITEMFKSSGFMKDYQRVHGTAPLPVAIATIVKDLGGMLAVSARRENEQYNWEFVLREIWWDEDENQDWENLSKKLAAAYEICLCPLITKQTGDDENGFARRYPGTSKETEFFETAAVVHNRDAKELKENGVVVSGRRVCIFTLMKMVQT